MDTEEAKKILENQRKEHVEKCTQGIKEILELYKCRIDITVILKAGQVIPQIDIIPTE